MAGRTRYGRTLVACARHALKTRKLRPWYMAEAIVELAHACYANISEEGAKRQRIEVLRGEIKVECLLGGPTEQGKVRIAKMKEEIRKLQHPEQAEEWPELVAVEGGGR